MAILFIKNKKRLSIFFLVIFILVLVVSGCSSKSYLSVEDSATSTAPSNAAPKEMESRGNTDTAGFGNEYKDEASQNTTDANNESYEGRKIIKSANVELETKEFDKTTNIITEKTNFLGGYIESSSITGGRPVNKEDFRNRVASFKLRIPEKSFDQLLLDFNDIGNVIRLERGGADITSEYFDSEARLKSLTIQEERLLEILKKADKITDIIELERELSNVRYQIENYTGTLRKWDNLVSFSTIDVIIYEVREIKDPEPVTLGDRIVDGFNKSIKGIISLGKELLVGIAVLLPIAIVILFIGLIAFYIGKKTLKKRNKGINKDEE